MLERSECAGVSWKGLGGPTFALGISYLCALAQFLAESYHQSACEGLRWQKSKCGITENMLMFQYKTSSCILVQEIEADRKLPGAMH